MFIGIPTKGILEKTGLKSLPSSLSKYFFCSPNGDYKLRCLPSSGGYYDQRLRDVIDFNIIENKLKEIKARK